MKQFDSVKLVLVPIQDGILIRGSDGDSIGVLKLKGRVEFHHHGEITYSGSGADPVALLDHICRIGYL